VIQEQIYKSVEDNDEVCFVTAFSGLFALHRRVEEEKQCYVKKQEKLRRCFSALC
jgi:glycerol kinase